MIDAVRRLLRTLIPDERGVALTEFALVAPILFVVLFGVIDFAKAFNYWNDETHLANIAARYAAVNGSPCASVSLQQCVQQQADSGELKNGGTASIATGNQARVCITFPNSTSQVGDPVQVTVSAKYNWMPILKLSATQSTITGSATMRLEATPSNYGTGCS